MSSKQQLLSLINQYPEAMYIEIYDTYCLFGSLLDIRAKKQRTFEDAIQYLLNKIAYKIS